MPEYKFDAREVEPAQDFEPVPAGWYDAKITGTEFKPTKAGTGEYLQIAWEIIGPKHAGRLVWSRLNLNNPNYQAVEIAKGDLSSICRAAGMWQLQQTEQLHGKICQIRLTIRAADGQYEATNEVKSYRASDNVAGLPAASTDKPNGNKQDKMPPWA
jgi:hypothetical protein